MAKTIEGISAVRKTEGVRSINKALIRAGRMWLAKNERALLKDYFALLRQPSVSARNEGLRETATLTAKLLQKYGVPSRLISVKGGPPIVYGEVGDPAGGTLLIYNHYDVQPPEPLELWKTPPFSPALRGGKVYARGAADNKGNIIIRLSAVGAALRLLGKLPLRLKFVIEGEEEIGSVHLEDFVRDHAETLSADACIWEMGGVNASNTPVLTLGCKGLLYIELEARGPRRDLHSAGATSIPNPAWRLIHALAALKDEHENILIPEFYSAVIPPTSRDLAALDELPDESEKTLKNLGLKSFLLGLKGRALKERNLFSPTCNICGITAGYGGQGPKTVLPAFARAKVDFRLVPNQDPDEILRKLRQYLDARGFTDVTIAEVYSREHPARTPLDHPFVEHIRDVTRQVYGKEPVIEPLTGGTGPMFPFQKYLRVPIVCLGAGYPGSRAHSPNENMRLSDLRTNFLCFLSLFSMPLIYG
jgi:acetylornithine deacetylase/succinyl-diaminopimelate desuccinylase-like protein